MLRRMTPRVAAPAVAAPRRFCATKAVATETAEATGCCTPANSYEAFKYGTASIIVFFLMLDGSVCKTVFAPVRNALQGSK